MTEEISQSKGHLFFLDGYEYFRRGGDIWKANMKDPMQFGVMAGYRYARFVCTEAAWPQIKELLERFEQSENK